MTKATAVPIDIGFVFDRFIGDGDPIDRLGDLLLSFAPDWSAKLKIFETAANQRPIDPRARGALRTAVVEVAAERGETFKALTTLSGAGGDRGQGSAELRGASGDLCVIISIDVLPFRYLGRRGFLGNVITVQLRAGNIGSMPARMWAREFFARGCEELAPTWATCWAVPEYWAKVMSEGPTIQAIGRDFARFLPGLFWQNFFGDRYVDLIGKDVLLAAPGRLVSEVDGGVLIGLGDDPADWTDPAYVATERAVLAAIGEQYFFDKSAPDRPTRAPRWLPDGPVEILGGSKSRNDG